MTSLLQTFRPGKVDTDTENVLLTCLANSSKNNETAGCQVAVQNVKPVLEPSNENTNNQPKTKSGKGHAIYLHNAHWTTSLVRQYLFKDKTSWASF